MKTADNNQYKEQRHLGTLLYKCIENQLIHTSPISREIYSQFLENIISINNKYLSNNNHSNKNKLNYRIQFSHFRYFGYFYLRFFKGGCGKSHAFYRACFFS